MVESPMDSPVSGPDFLKKSFGKCGLKTGTERKKQCKFFII